MKQFLKSKLALVLIAFAFGVSLYFYFSPGYERAILGELYEAVEGPSLKERPIARLEKASERTWVDEAKQSSDGLARDSVVVQQGDVKSFVDVAYENLKKIPAFDLEADMMSEGLLEAGQLVEEMRNRLEKDKSLVGDVMGLYKRCVESTELNNTLKALCYFELQSLGELFKRAELLQDLQIDPKVLELSEDF